MPSLDKPRHPSDPRVDLISDHRNWKNVLWNSWHENKEMYYLLHGLRCGGAELVETLRSYRLMPGEWVQEEWDSDIKNRLNPFRDKLVSVFKASRLGRIVETREEEIREVFGCEVTEQLKLLN